MKKGNYLNSLFLKLYARKVTIAKCELNLFGIFMITIGLLLGSYLTVKNIIPKIFATTQGLVTYQTANDFNTGTYSSTQLSGTGSPVSIGLSVSSSPAWYNNGWKYRKAIAIDHTKVSSDLTNLPVLISFSSDSDLAANSQASGNDILFTSSDGITKLNHKLFLVNIAIGLRLLDLYS